MFFERNKNLLIATGAVALLWVILFYVLIAPNWEKADENLAEASGRRKKWEALTNGDEDRKDAKADKRTNEFKPRAEAERELNQSSKLIEQKFEELKRIEFGTHTSLRAFSTAAAGKGGDTSNLLSEKLKQTKDRANTIFKVKVDQERFAARFRDENAGDPLNLLRLALVDRFMTACKEVKDVNTKECRIEEIVAVDYFEPKVIPMPEDDKSKAVEKVKDEESAETPAPKTKGKGKDKDKNAEKPEEVDRLVQIPMKVVVRSTERYITQLLYELSQPTPIEQNGEDRRGYFCVRGFHQSLSTAVGSTGEKLVEMSVGVSALLTQSEIRALGITFKGMAEPGKTPPKPEDY